MPDENDIRKLLKLKRYEQPPPEYFDQFLREFQQRQRSELLRQPLWKIALNRLQAFLNEPSMGQFAYAGATVAVLLIAGLASVKIVSSGNPNNIALAKTSVPVRQVAQRQNQNSLALDSRIRLADWSTFQNPTAQPGVQSSTTRPHYVIDARPVSYEPPSSF